MSVDTILSCLKFCREDTDIDIRQYVYANQRQNGDSLNAVYGANEAKISFNSAISRESDISYFLLRGVIASGLSFSGVPDDELEDRISAVYSKCPVNYPDLGDYAQSLTSPNQLFEEVSRYRANMRKCFEDVIDYLKLES